MCRFLLLLEVEVEVELELGSADIVKRCRRTMGDEDDVEVGEIE